MDIILEDGRKVNCNIVANINKDNKKYIVYDDGKELHASRYIIENNEMKLLPIETDEEWDFIDNYLNSEVYNGNK